MKKKIIIVVIILIAIIGIRLSGIGEHISFSNLKANRDKLTALVQHNYIISMLIFIGVYYVSTALSLPGATLLTLTGGFLFGTIFGVIYVNISATLGALSIFLIVRYLIGNTIQKKYAQKLDKFNKLIDQKGYSYLLTLRLIPIFPFFLINMFAGLTKVSAFTFLWTTSLGIIPGSFVYTYAGKQLCCIDGIKDILSTNVIIAFVLLGLLALIPSFVKKNKSDNIKRRKK